MILISPLQKEVMGGYLGGRRSVGKLRDRLVDAVQRNA
jgi:hypothetical protein